MMKYLYHARKSGTKGGGWSTTYGSRPWSILVRPERRKRPLRDEETDRFFQVGVAATSRLPQWCAQVHDRARVGGRAFIDGFTTRFYEMSAQLTARGGRPGDRFGHKLRYEMLELARMLGKPGPRSSSGGMGVTQHSFVSKRYAPVVNIGLSVVLWQRKNVV